LRRAVEIARYPARDAKTFTQLRADYCEFTDTTYLPLMYWRPLPPLTGTGQIRPIVDRLFENRVAEQATQFANCLQQRFGGVTSSS